MTMHEMTCRRCGKKAMKRSKGRQFCSYSCSSLWKHEQGVFDDLKSRRGPEHHNWKPEVTDYKSIHARIGRERGKAQECILRPKAGCASEKYEWSHIHDTDPLDVMNYRPLCKSCHITYDGQRGSGHANAKLTPEQAAEIRRLYATRGVTQQELADRYGVGQTNISRIVRQRTYLADAHG